MPRRTPSTIHGKWHVSVNNEEGKVYVIDRETDETICLVRGSSGEKKLQRAKLMEQISKMYEMLMKFEQDLSKQPEQNDVIERILLEIEAFRELMQEQGLATRQVAATPRSQSPNAPAAISGIAGTIPIEF